MAGHPLDPIFDKLDRGKESLDTLKSEFDTFSNAHPLTVGFKPNIKAEWHTAYVERGEMPPPRLSILAGESLYHARSSLEHLVWALVKSNKKKPGKDHTFPILPVPVGTKGMSDKQAFIAKTKRKELSGVPIAAIALIEQLQPYNARYPAYYFLTIVNRMAREDRHRALHGQFVGGSNPAVLPGLFIPHRNAQIVDFKVLLKRNQRLVIGKTNLARLKIRPWSRQPKMKVKGRLPTLIAFGSGRDYFALAELYSINTDVRNVLSAFKKFF